MNSDRKSIMEGVAAIAADLRAKAAAAGNDQVLGLIAKLEAALAAKPDSYFTAALYPAADRMDCGASYKVWREVAAQVSK